MLLIKERVEQREKMRRGRIWTIIRNIKVQFNGSLHFTSLIQINIDECLNVNMNIHPFKSTYLNLMDSS